MSNIVRSVNKAAFEGNLNEFVDLLSQNPQMDVREMFDEEDAARGPLHFAVLGKQRDLVTLLLDKYSLSPFTLDQVKHNYLSFFIFFCFQRMVGVRYMLPLQLEVQTL